MTEHYDLSETSRYSEKELTLPLHEPEPVGDDALKVMCPSCLSSWRVPSSDGNRDSARNYRCSSAGCDAVIRVIK